MGDVERLAEQVAAVGPAVAAAQVSAQVTHDTGPVEVRSGPVGRLGRIAQQLLVAGAARSQAGDMQRDAEGAPGGEGAGDAGLRGTGLPGKPAWEFRPSSPATCPAPRKSVSALAGRCWPAAAGHGWAAGRHRRAPSPPPRRGHAECPFGRGHLVEHPHPITAPNGGYLKSPAKSASGQAVCGGDMSPPTVRVRRETTRAAARRGQSQVTWVTSLPVRRRHRCR